MKPGIHPIWYPDARVTCACGNTWTTGSTKKEIHTDVCNNCHPFFTGEQRIVDTAGQVERFMKRLNAKEEIAATLPAPEEKKAKKDKRRDRKGVGAAPVVEAPRAPAKLPVAEIVEEKPAEQPMVAEVPAPLTVEETAAPIEVIELAAAEEPTPVAEHVEPVVAEEPIPTEEQPVVEEIVTAAPQLKEKPEVVQVPAEVIAEPIAVIETPSEVIVVEEVVAEEPTPQKQTKPRAIKKPAAKKAAAKKPATKAKPKAAAKKPVAKKSTTKAKSNATKKTKK